MILRKNCLKKRKDFLTVFKEGEKIQGRFFYLKFIMKEEDLSRFGIVISKKVLRKATERNKIKRRTRAILREKILKEKKGIDCVLFFHSVPNSFKILEEEIEKAFKRIS